MHWSCVGGLSQCRWTLYPLQHRSRAGLKKVVPQYALPLHGPACALLLREGGPWLTRTMMCLQPRRHRPLQPRRNLPRHQRRHSKRPMGTSMTLCTP